MIVKEYKTTAGVTIKFNNSFYADKSKNEKMILQKELDKATAKILWEAAQKN